MRDECSGAASSIITLLHGSELGAWVRLPRQGSVLQSHSISPGWHETRIRLQQLKQPPSFVTNPVQQSTGTVSKPSVPPGPLFGCPAFLLHLSLAPHCELRSPEHRHPEDRATETPQPQGCWCLNTGLQLLFKE